MSKTFSLNQLAEGIQRKQFGADMPRLHEKWARSGLLAGLKESDKDNMCRILENQATEVLREANALSMGGGSLVSSGQINGFTNVAFPVVRRVFAGLLSKNLVSTQPMSLPTGLLFYLDYSDGSNVGGDAGMGLSDSATASTYKKNQSMYGNPTGNKIREGAFATGGQYDLVGTGFSKVHKTSQDLNVTALDDVGFWVSGSTWASGSTAVVTSPASFTGFNARFTRYDGKIETDLADNVLDFCFLHMSASEVTTKIAGADLSSLEQIAITGFGSAVGSAVAWGEGYQGGQGILNLRKLNKRGNWNPSTGLFVPDPVNGTHVQFVLRIANGGAAPQPNGTATTKVTASAAISDALSVNSDGSTLTIPSFESDFAINPPMPVIPEININLETISVTATTRKLRARWSPEMAQDASAYINLDIEAELTNILSERVTLEIDREILNDLLTQANACNLYWSRAPGKLVNKVTGQEVMQSSALSPGPMAYTNVQDWYQTLLETISDAANTIGQKTLRGSANFIVTSPQICTILEHTQAWRTAYKIDSNGQVSDDMTIGAQAAGTISDRYTVYRDMYFPANRILVGLKGNTFLESGYIYAPYVPLILTQTVYGQEDFTPRRGIMTRYGKKMVRADFYATITVLDMNVI